MKLSDKLLAISQAAKQAHTKASQAYVDQVYEWLTNLCTKKAAEGLKLAKPAVNYGKDFTNFYDTYFGVDSLAIIETLNVHDLLETLKARFAAEGMSFVWSRDKDLCGRTLKEDITIRWGGAQ